jgi:hypothetical protein
LARAATIAASVAVLTTSACGSGAPLPPTPPTVEVKMREYRFEFPASIPKDRVNVRVVNAGRLPHELALIPLPPGFPPIREQLRGRARRAVDTLAGVPVLRPGDTDTFAVDFAPSRYALVCFRVDPDGGSHALKGMASEFRVR